MSEAQAADVPEGAHVARAQGHITMPPALVDRLTTLKKGNAYEVARLAGIMAAKRTAALLPSCHGAHLDSVSLELTPGAGRVRVTAEVRATGRAGVEMEALAAVNVALLTLYDMGKAVARDMEIGGVALIQ